MMKRFYKYTDNTVIEVVTADDGKSEVQSKTPVANAHELVASGSAIIYETHETLKVSMSYVKNRRIEYPSTQEQFDLLYHELTASGSLTTSGSWYKTITSVKEENPKG